MDAAVTEIYAFHIDKQDGRCETTTVRTPVPAETVDMSPRQS